MLRYILAARAAIVLLAASLIPDDAYARGGRGGGEASAAAVADFTVAASEVAACMPDASTAVLEGSTVAVAMRDVHTHHIR